MRQKDRQPHPPASPVPSLKLSRLGGPSSPARKVVSLSQTARSTATSPTVQLPFTSRWREGEVAPSTTSQHAVVVVSPSNALKQAIRVTSNDLQLTAEIAKLTKCSRARVSRGSGTVDVAHQLLGDAHLYTALRALGVEETGASEEEPTDSPQSTIETLVLRDNRLTDAGFERILRCIRTERAIKHSLRVLDISENSIKRKGIEELGLVLKSTAMVKLSVENMALGDTSSRALFDSFEETDSSLASLFLSSNKIGDVGAQRLALQLKRSLRSLTELDLSWNEIRSAGAVALCDALGGGGATSAPSSSSTSGPSSCPQLAKLDLSWNALGSKDDSRAAVKALSAMLASNSSLVHLDLSQNQFSAQDCSILSEGLKSNHSLLGLHMVGNASKSDVYGQMVPDVEKWPLESAHSMTRIMGSKVLGRERWALRTCCWICGCYRETRFEYTLLHRDVAFIWDVISRDPNALAAIHAAEKAALLKKQKEEAAARAADPLYDFMRSLEPPPTQPSDDEASVQPKPAATQPPEPKPLPESYPIVVQICASFDGWVPESMLKLTAEQLAELRSVESGGEGEGEGVSEGKDELLLHRPSPVSRADERAILAGVSREEDAKHAARSRSTRNPSEADKPQTHTAVTDQVQQQENCPEEVQRPPGNGNAIETATATDQPAVEESPVDDDVVQDPSVEPELPPESSLNVEVQVPPTPEDTAELLSSPSPPPSLPAFTSSEPSSPGVGKSASGTFELHRMAPPGLHYFVFSVNSGPLTYDAWQPHKRTSDLLDIGLRVPVGVQLPEFVNTTEIAEPSEAEKLAGLSSFVTIKVQPRVKNSQTVQLKKVWTLKDCLFSQTQHLYEERHQQVCFSKDWAQTRAAKGRDRPVVDQLHSILSKHFSILRRVFETYCVLFSGETYFMGPGAFNEFVAKSQIIEQSSENGRSASISSGDSLPTPFPRSSSKARFVAAAAADAVVAVANAAGADAKVEGGTTPFQPASVPIVPTGIKPSGKPATSSSQQGKGATRTELELIFVSNTITGPKHEANSKRALCRFQFLDVLVQIAVVKLVKTGLEKDAPRALKRLIEQYIEPYAEYERSVHGFHADFRHRFMLTEELDTVFKRQQKAFARAFKKFSGAENMPLEPKTMSFKEYLEWTEKSDLASLGLGDRARQLAFIRAKITPPDPFDDSNVYKQLSYLEFLYAIARCAYAIRSADADDSQSAALTPLDLVEIIDTIALRC